MLHIRCGHDIEESLRAAGIPGDYLAYADPVCQGPTPAALEGAEWIDVRAAFIEQAYGEPAATARAQLSAMQHQLEQVRDHSEVVLWFEHDLFDQAILARLCAWCAPRDLGHTRVSLVTLDAHPSIERFIGLGSLRPEQLSALFPSRIPVTDDMILAGERAWAALRRSDPTSLAELAAGPRTALPFLRGAIRRHLRELPWTSDGLGMSERLFLRAVDEGARTAGAAFRRAQDHEPAPWMGDVMGYHVMATLAAGEHPLLTLETPWPADAEAFAEAGVAITPQGREVLAGRRDAVAVRGIDRWVGGIQLRGRTARWRWDEELLRPIRG